MDGYQFWASIAQSLASFAWPVAVLCIALAFRNQITQLLPLLTFKYKDLEASFRLDQAAEEALTLPTIPKDRVIEPTPEEESKYEKLAELRRERLFWKHGQNWMRRSADMQM